MSTSIHNHINPSFSQNKNTLSSTHQESLSQRTQGYNEYVMRKKNIQSSSQQKESSNNKKSFIIIISVVFLGIFLFITLFTFQAKLSGLNNKQTSDNESFFVNSNHIYTRHQHYVANPPSTAPQSSNCNSFLPYKISQSTQTDIQQIYHKWYGKVGSNINGRYYDSGHFIERHIAIDGKCTKSQKEEGKTVFYDWNQVIKAYNQTISNICPLSDRTTFNYVFETKIASPTNYIKGIDCQSGRVINFPKILALYRRAIKIRNPSPDDYFHSNYVTLWTFYPKA